jgi:hypothetical protein
MQQQSPQQKIHAARSCDLYYFAHKIPDLFIILSNPHE